ncbi:MAG TPA: 4-hydroxythreonine-4-phosphate dehydrogenase PdxA [Gammaproteobacteria bacterium]|nr:4-hydroxythreonine-4-phosphate dehydrogenase PdxA [Gammaproteobacteria bacterium]
MTARIALSVGEPAGIGPDLAVLLAQRARAAEIVAYADPGLLEGRARQLGLPLELIEHRPGAAPQAGAAGSLRIVPSALAAPATAGTPDPANAAYVLDALGAACDACVAGSVDALVTGPVHKAVINEAGIAFTGHTEWLAERTGADLPVMLLAAGILRVALVTTHLSLAAVPAAITAERVERVLRILASGLERDFGIDQPRILTLGLNPHAGEGGHLGTEEQSTIIPVLEKLRAEGLAVEGPLPADTAFVPARLAGADAVLAMYHDQGLPVLKHAGFGHAVNITLGLPIVRTSVDHGTALDRAGTGRIDPGSLETALAMATDIAALRLRANGTSIGNG